MTTGSIGVQLFVSPSYLQTNEIELNAVVLMVLYFP